MTFSSTTGSRGDCVRPAILAEAGLHAAWMARPLLEAGFTLRTCPLIEMPEQVATGRFNAVVFGPCFLPRRTLQEAEAFADRLVAAVHGFLAAGGGVFLSSPSGELVGQRLLAAVDASVLPLQIEQPNDCFQIAPGSTAGYTDAVCAPFNHQLAGFWFPLLQGAAETSRPVGGNGWRAIATASPQSRTKPLAQVGHGLPGDDIPGYETSVPLIAVRDGAAGRLALCGVNAGFHLYSPPNFPLARRYLGDGFDGRPSGLRRLFLNLLAWLVAPSVESGALGGAATDPAVLEPQAPRFPPDPPVRWACRSFPPDPRPRTGLIGARTALSGGRGTVAEYVAKAKAAGHDFIVFLERFPELTQSGLERLKAQCEEASDNAFLAVPGYVLRDVVGSWFFQYGYAIDLPRPDILSDDGSRLAHRPGTTGRTGRISNVHLSFIFGELHTRCRRGTFRHAESAKGILQNRATDSIAVTTWEDGRLVDDIRDSFPMLLDKGLRLHPTALTLMDGPEDFERALASGWRNTILEPYAAMSDRVVPKHMAPELERWTVFDAEIFNSPRYRFDCWQYGMPCQCATGGPVIQAWTVSVSDRDSEWREPDNAIPPTADPFRVDVAGFRLRLRVTAAAGLAEVLLRDGERILRRWLPNGVDAFEKELDLTHHQQMHLHLEARDRQGGSAISGDYLTYRRDWCEFYCADRNNPLCIGYEKDADGYAYGWSGTRSLTYNNAMWGGSSPYAGKWWYYGDRIYPVPMDPLRDETGPFDGGVGAGGAGLNVKLDPGPQNPPERGLMLEPLQEMISPDVAICGFVCDRGYDPDTSYFRGEPPGFGMYGTFTTRYLHVRRRATVFRPKPYALTTLVYHYDVRWKRLPRVAGPIFAGWFSSATRAVLEPADGRSVDLAALEAGEALCWRRNDAVVLWTEGARPAIFFNDGADLLLMRGHPDGRDETWRNADDICLALPADCCAATGVSAAMRVVGVGGTHAHTDSGIVAKVRAAMGLRGPAAYTAAFERGTPRSARILFELAADKGEGVAFELPRVELPMALPVAVHDLHPERPVVLYDRARRRWRPLGALEGVAYATLDTAERDWRVFIGHPVGLSNPSATFALTQTATDVWMLEIHNPTGRAIQADAAPAPEFDLLDWDGETVTLPPGSSITRNLRMR